MPHRLGKIVHRFHRASEFGALVSAFHTLFRSGHPSLIMHCNIFAPVSSGRSLESLDASQIAGVHSTSQSSDAAFAYGGGASSTQSGLAACETTVGGRGGCGLGLGTCIPEAQQSRRHALKPRR